jgi:MiaB-like tRNA modifying enzyme
MAEDTKRVYVKSFGCSVNLADGEVIAGCFSEAGFEVVGCPRDAEILVYNTCAVKSPTEDRIINILKKAPRSKQLVVTGCLPLINFERLKDEVKFDGMTGPAPGSKIVEVLRRIAAGENVVFLGGVSKPSLYLPRIPVNPVVSIVPINYGCLGDCSYCCVHFARGRLRSYSIEEVVDRVKQDLDSGAKEIWLTSQDTACYGRDIGTSLVDLLNQVCEIEGDFFIRVGMMNPDHVLGMLDDLVEAYKYEKLFKFLHLPIQSGDDNVLELMNRHYTVDDFRTIIQVFRKEIPRLTLSTDVICGFPGESREAFLGTKRLLQEVNPDIVNVSKFFSRPHTSAEKMAVLSPKEVKRRSGQVAELSRMISLDRNRRWMGWKGPVLFDERGKGESWMGRNFAYKPVVVKGGESLVGRFVHIRVINALATYLEAELA